MILLAADTSGKNGSIALVRADAATGSIDVIEIVALAGGTFSAQLVPQIAGLLAKHGFRKNDVSGFVVASGPGSFTGLRVGLAAIKALAEILQKPIVAISLLEVIAALHAKPGVAATALDAGRGEVYLGRYEVGNDSLRRLDELLVKRDAVGERVESNVLISPDAALIEAARSAGRPAMLVDALTAGDVARAGWRRLLAGDTVSPEQLEANYIRRSDAEEWLLASGS